MKSTPLFVSLFSLVSLMSASSGFSQSSTFVGSDRCGHYTSEDTRPLPPTRRMLSAFFDVEGSGYVLNVNYEGEGRVASYKFDSDLKFKYEDRNQLKISSEGKFEFGINHRTEWCVYSGTAKMSPQASRILFPMNSAYAQTLELNNSSIVGRWSYPGGGTYAGVITIKNDETFTFVGLYSPTLKSKGTWSFNIKSQELTLEFEDKLISVWNSKKQVLKVVNDYKQSYDRFGSSSNNKCRFMILFEGVYFDKLFC